MKIDTDRGTFGVRRAGEQGSRALVLLHPLALDGRFWAPMSEALAEDRDVLALDARGHGDSDWDGVPFTVEDLADDVAAVLDACSIQTADVVGMSMGGCTALAFAGRHPHRVQRLVLADTTSCYGPERVQRWAERATQAAEVPRVDQLPFQLGRWFSDRFRAEHEAEVTRVIDIFLSTPSPVHAQACLALGDFDGRALLAGIAAPTTIYVGEHDQATPVAMAEELHRGIGASTIDVLRDARHFSLLERRDIWSQLGS